MTARLPPQLALLTPKLESLLAAELPPVLEKWDRLTGEQFTGDDIELFALSTSRGRATGPQFAPAGGVSVRLSPAALLSAIRARTLG
jgi:hypothetical protein